MKHPDAIRAEAARLRHEGGSLDDISRRLRIRKSTICEWLRGVPAGILAEPPVGVIADASRAEVIRLRLDKGWSEARILRETGASWSDVRRWVLEVEQATATPEPSRAPPDTRTLGQRLCGDPVFERSALYQKRRQSA